MKDEELLLLKNRILAKKQDFIIEIEKILLKIIRLDIAEITKKFSFKNMQTEYPEFCPMFTKDKPCHEMPPEELNCYNCYCPDYKLEITFDEEKNLYKLGICSIKSKFGFYKLTKTRNENPKNYLILNCINCKIPHSKIFTKKILEKDIKKSNIGE